MISPTVAQLIGGGIVAMISVAGTYLVNKNKSTAETEEIAANTYRRLNQDLLKQLSDAKKQYEAELAEARKNYEARLAGKEAEFAENLRQIKSEYERKIDTITDDFEERIQGLEKELERYHEIEKKVGTVIIENKPDILKE